MALQLIIGSTDQTAKILGGSITLKLNTLDLALIDPIVVPSLLDAATVTGMGGIAAWAGSVASVETFDPVDRTGHVIVNVTALSTALPTIIGSPFDLSDNPGDRFTSLELENGTGHLLAEDGTVLDADALTVGYAGLAVKQTINPSTTPGTGALTLEDASGHILTEDGTAALLTEGTSSADFLGHATIYQSGLWPGMVFNLTSTNQGYSSQPFTCQLVTVRYIGLATPAYLIDFGSTIFTLNGLYTKN